MTAPSPLQPPRRRGSRPPEEDVEVMRPLPTQQQVTDYLSTVPPDIQAGHMHQVYAAVQGNVDVHPEVKSGLYYAFSRANPTLPPTQVHQPVMKMVLATASQVNVGELNEVQIGNAALHAMETGEQPDSAAYLRATQPTAALPRDLGGYVKAAATEFFPLMEAAIHPTDPEPPPAPTVLPPAPAPASRPPESRGDRPSSPPRPSTSGRSGWEKFRDWAKKNWIWIALASFIGGSQVDKMVEHRHDVHPQKDIRREVDFSVLPQEAWWTIQNAMYVDEDTRGFRGWVPYERELRPDMGGDMSLPPGWQHFMANPPKGEGPEDNLVWRRHQAVKRYLEDPSDERGIKRVLGEGTSGNMPKTFINYRQLKALFGAFGPDEVRVLAAANALAGYNEFEAAKQFYFDRGFPRER
ncbi:Uncharacterised protein [uncultured archaeon]|nr:Uncharacterised protein [uncultured archaeon]